MEVPPAIETTPGQRRVFRALLLAVPLFFFWYWLVMPRSGKPVRLSEELLPAGQSTGVVVFQMPDSLRLKLLAQPTREQPADAARWAQVKGTVRFIRGGQLVAEIPVAHGSSREPDLAATNLLPGRAYLVQSAFEQPFAPPWRLCVQATMFRQQQAKLDGPMVAQVRQW